MTSARRLAVAFSLFTAGTAHGEDFVNAASSSDRPVMFDVRLFGGTDERMTVSPFSGPAEAGFAVGADVSLRARTRLGAWASYALGGESCLDGFSAKDDPFLGCYVMTVAAGGLRLRQGLLEHGPLQLGVEAGASVQTIPARSLVLGTREDAAVNASVQRGSLLPFAQLGGGLAQAPRLEAHDRLAFFAAGLEWTTRRVQPSLSATVEHVWYSASFRGDATRVLVAFGIGFGAG